MAPRKLTHQSIWDAEALRKHMIAYKVKPVHLRNVWKFAFICESIADVCNQLLQVKSPPPARWLKALQEDFLLCTSTVIDYQSKNLSAGCKLVVQTQDGLVSETVVMRPDSNGRVTLCVSSQVGCKMGCTFCETGTLGRLGQLTGGEIVEQLYLAHQWAKDGSLGETRIRNIVFMGMGEPLDNYSAVLAAVEAMICEVSFGILGRHITISTVGVISRIQQMAVEPLVSNVNLAVSLHAATQETRLRIVPSAKGSPIDKLVEAMFEYCRVSNRGIMIEYIVLAGLNDLENDAMKLAELLNGLNCWVNLIPYNTTAVGESHGFLPPSHESLRKFEQAIRRCGGKNHIGEPICIRTRFSTQSGQDSESACGQLAAAATAMLKGPTKHKDGLADVEDLVAVPNPKDLMLKNPRLKRQSSLANSRFSCYRYDVFVCASVAISMVVLYRWCKHVA